MLSRYTVLPWEDVDEYRVLVEALVAEHVPQGPTEEHLVEEVAGILWRKRRLRLAEAAAHRRGLEKALDPYRETAKAALVHVGAEDQNEKAADAVRVTAEETAEDLADLDVVEAMTRHALDVLNSAAMTPMRQPLRRFRTTLGNGGRRPSPTTPTRTTQTRSPIRPMSTGCAVSLKARSSLGTLHAAATWRTGQ